MNLSLIAYVGAISLQIAGALMLIIFAISTKREKVVRAFARSHVTIRDGETKKLSYDHDAFVDDYRVAYFSKISVCFIALGYLIGIFGDIGDYNRLFIALAVIVITVALIIVSYTCVKGLLKKNSNKKISDEELESIGAKPDLELNKSKICDHTLVLDDNKALK